MLSINQLAWVANVLVSTVSGGAVGGHRGHHLPCSKEASSPLWWGGDITFPEWRGHPLCSETTGLGATAGSLWASQSEGAEGVAGGIGHIAGKGRASLDFQGTFNFFFFSLFGTFM